MLYQVICTKKDKKGFPTKITGEVFNSPLAATYYFIKQRNLKNTYSLLIHKLGNNIVKVNSDRLAFITSAITKEGEGIIEFHNRSLNPNSTYEDVINVFYEEVEFLRTGKGSFIQYYVLDVNTGEIICSFDNYPSYIKY